MKEVNVGWGFLLHFRSTCRELEDGHGDLLHGCIGLGGGRGWQGLGVGRGVLAGGAATAGGAGASARGCGKSRLWEGRDFRWDCLLWSPGYGGL